jgi:hypothetical protein
MINGQLTVTHSSAASMQKAVAKLNEILCRELKSLELQPLSEDELELKLNELQDSIPEVVVERITRRTGEMVQAGGCPDCR